MQCPSCGTPFTEGSSQCSHCDNSAAGNQFISTDSSYKSNESTRSSLPDRKSYESTLPYLAPLPFQMDQPGPYSPLHPYLMTPSAPRNKKKRIMVIALISLAAIVLFALLTGVFYKAVLSAASRAQNSDPTSLSSLQQLHMMSRAESRWNPYTKHQDTLVLQDSLEDNSTSLEFNYHWLDEDTDADKADATGCHFSNHSYHVYIDAQKPTWDETYCVAAGTQFNDITYQVDMTIMQGNAGGIIFREDTHHRFYTFMVSRYGGYVLASSGTSNSKLLTSGNSPYIHQGLNQTNTLAVVTSGATLDLYANEHLLASIKDTTYITGRIGMIVIGDKKQNVDAAFSNAKVWQDHK